MKQVSTATHSLDLRSPFHDTPNLRNVFSRYFLFLLLAGFAIVSSSFQMENRISSSQKLLKTSVPFKGKFTYYLSTNAGTGTASHIGKFSIVEPNNHVEQNEQGLLVTGLATITAANGDELYATHSGLVQFLGNGMAQVNSEFIITAGTGRFAGVNGSFEVEGPANLATGTVDFTFDGSISY